MKVLIGAYLIMLMAHRYCYENGLKYSVTALFIKLTITIYVSKPDLENRQTITHGTLIIIHFYISSVPQ